MAFSLRKFIKNGFLQAIGNKAEYEIRLAAASWLDKGVLLEDDLADIESAIEESKKEIIVEQETI